MALARFRDETVGYRDKAVLRNVSFSIEPGDRIALVGESGVGKTTLLRLIYEKCQGRAALVPQDHGLVEALSVFHNVYMGRLHEYSVWRNFRNLLFPARADIAAVEPLLDDLRLVDKLRTPVGELSGGQKQRTAVGRAMFNRGDILIADEPVSSVDEHQAREILSLINSRKDTVVLAMHDRALAIEFASRLIGLKYGRVVFDAPSAGLKPEDLDSLYKV